MLRSEAVFWGLVQRYDFIKVYEGTNANAPLIADFTDKYVHA